MPPAKPPTEPPTGRRCRRPSPPCCPQRRRTEPPTGRRCRRPSPPCCPQSCPRRGKATAAKRAAVLLAWLGFGLSGRFSRPCGVLVVLLVWRLSFGLAVSAFRLFFSGPLFPRIKKKTKSRSLPALSGVCLFVVCAAVVCRLCCSCLSFCIASHQSKDKKLFCFGRLAFCFALPRLPPTKEKDKKLFCFGRLAFCFFFASLGGGYIHIYIYTEQMRLYLKRPLGAARKTPRKPKT